MANETPGGNEIWQLGLDIGPYIKSLQDALKAYASFSEKLGKTLSVRLDPTSLNGLAQAFGVQMRQAMQKTSQETIVESMKAANAVQKTFRESFVKGFNELPEAIRKNTEKMSKEAARSGEAAGRAFSSGWAKGQQDKDMQEARRLQREFGRAALNMPGNARQNMSRLQDMLGQDWFQVPNRVHAETGKLMVDMQGMQDRLRALKDALRSFSAFKDSKAIFPQPTYEQRIAAAQYQRGLAKFSQMQFAPGDTPFFGRQQYLYPQPLPIPKGPKASPLGGLAEEESKRRLGLENQIGNSILRNTMFLAKYVVLYRIVHDAARAVEKVLTGFIASGIQYSKELETQQLALRGILAENYLITVNHGQQLKGLAAVTALQTTSAAQWRQIQQASLAVVGSTADLMQLYTGILPFASKLGANLQTVQALTKDTAIAARLLDVSFQDARSGMVALLQGRALTRNRLVGALGFTKEEIRDLKGTPQLIQAISDRLSDFAELSDEAQNTIAAMSESLRDFSGIIAAGFTRPFTDAFKKFVGGLTDANSKWALFEKTVGGLKIKDNVQSFINFTSAAVTQALGPVKEFGRALMEGIGTNSKDWVVAIRDAATGVTQMAVALTKGTLALFGWIAQHRLLIDYMVKLAEVLIVVLAVRRFTAAVAAATTGTGLLARAILMVRGTMISLSDKTVTMGQVAKQVTGNVASLGQTMLLSLGRGLLVGAVLGGLEMIITKLVSMRQAVLDTREAMDAAAKDDVGHFTVSAHAALSNKSTSKEDQLKLIEQAKSKLDQKSQALNALVGSSDSEVAAKAEEYNQALANLSAKQEAAAHKVTKARTSGNRAAIEAALGENAEIKKQILDKKKEVEEIVKIAQDIVTLTSIKDELMAAAGTANLSSSSSYGSPTMTAFRKGKLVNLTPSKKDALASPSRKVLEAFSRGRLAIARGDLFQELAQPTLTPPPAEKQPIEHTYHSLAEQEQKEAERRAAIAISNTELEVAQRVKTEEEGAQAIEQIELELLDERLAIWNKENEHHEAHVKKMTDDERQQKKDTIADRRQAIKSNIDDTTADYIKKLNDNKIAGINRDKAYDNAIADARAKYAKMREEIFGSSEDSATARFDAQINDIAQSLDKFQNRSASARNEVEGLVAALRALRNSKLQAEHYDSVISRTSKELDTSRSLEGLLQRDLDNGTVSPEVYLRRLRELRQNRINQLRQQAGAYAGLATLRKQGIASEMMAGTVSGTIDFDKVGRLTAEMNAFTAQEQAAKAEMADILSLARRVETALQAWDTLLGRFQGFLSIADGINGANGALGTMLHLLTGGASALDRIIKSTADFARLPAAFRGFKASFTDTGGLGGSFGALGSLLSGNLHSTVPSLNVTSGLPVPGAGGNATSSSGISTGSNLAKSIPLIGFGVSAAFAIAGAIMQRAVEKAKKQITSDFKKIGEAFSQGSITLGDYLGQLQKAREDAIKRYSGSKSGRSALKELLPQIDEQIASAKQQAKEAQKSFEEMFKRMKVGTGVFGDFARDLMDLEKTINDYLNSIDTSTSAGVKQYASALEQVREFRDEWFREAKQKFQEETLGFEGEALSAQEQYFSMLDQQESLYKELRDLGEQREALEEAIADEAERRAEFQKKQNELSEKELDLRKQIAEIMRKANDEEEAIRRRGVLEAQLTIAQQKALEINQVRNDAIAQIDDLKKQIEDLGQQRDDAAKDEAKQEARKDRDLDRQRRGLDERETDIRKQTRLNQIRLQGARAVAQLEGSIFGMASDEYDLAVRQNDLQLRQAEIQVQKWKDTKALIDSIVESATGVFFDPPDGFPQIHVKLGDITIDNRDQSNITVNGGGSGTPPRTPRDPDSPDPRPRPGDPDERPGKIPKFVDIERQLIR